MLSFLSLNQILLSASLCRHWYDAIDQSQPWSHITIESSRYDLIADGFAAWLCKVGTQTEIEELSLRISAPQYYRGRHHLVQFLSLKKLVLWAESSPENVTYTITDIICNIPLTGCLHLEHLEVRACLTTELVSALMNMSYSDRALKHLMLYFVRGSDRAAQLELDEDTYARIVITIFHQHESLEHLSVRLECAFERHDWFADFAGGTIGGASVQQMFLFSLSEMKHLRSLEYPFFPPLEDVSFSSEVLENVRIRVCPPRDPSLRIDRFFDLNFILALPASVKELFITRRTLTTAPSAEEILAFYNTNRTALKEKFTNLRTLGVYGANLGLYSSRDIAIDFFRSCPNLQSLVLYDCQDIRMTAHALTEVATGLTSLELRTKRGLRMERFAKDVMDENSGVHKLVYNRIMRTVIVRCGIHQLPPHDIHAEFLQYVRDRKAICAVSIRTWT
jgi:hypothetical protein